MMRGATKPICCCGMASGDARSPSVMPFADAVDAHPRLRALRAGGHRRGSARRKHWATAFALSAIRQPDALWVARLAQTHARADDAPGPLYLRAPDAKLPAAKALSDVAPVRRAMPISRRWRRCMPPAFPMPGMPRRSARLLADAGHLCLCAIDDGFVLARAAGGEAEILTLAVAPTGARQGAWAAPCCRRPSARRRAWAPQTMFLEVGRDNPAALALYAGLGFTKVGHAQGLLSSGSADA